jgi:hypothetical protein
MWAYRLSVVAADACPSARSPNNPRALDTIRVALEADPRVVSFEEAAAVAAQERLRQHQGEVAEARRADRVAQLEAQVAEQAARIAELERQQMPTERSRAMHSNDLHGVAMQANRRQWWMTERQAAQRPPAENQGPLRLCGRLVSR